MHIQTRISARVYAYIERVYTYISEWRYKVILWRCRALLRRCRALLRRCRALLRRCRALFRRCRALLHKYRDFVWIRIYNVYKRTFLSGDPCHQDLHVGLLTFIIPPPNSRIMPSSCPALPSGHDTHASTIRCTSSLLTVLAVVRSRQHIALLALRPHLAVVLCWQSHQRSTAQPRVCAHGKGGGVEWWQTVAAPNACTLQHGRVNECGHQLRYPITVPEPSRRCIFLILIICKYSPTPRVKRTFLSH